MQDAGALGPTLFARDPPASEAREATRLFITPFTSQPRAGMRRFLSLSTLGSGLQPRHKLAAESRDPGSPLGGQSRDPWELYPIRDLAPLVSPALTSGSAQTPVQRQLSQGPVWGVQRAPPCQGSREPAARC